MEPKREGSMKVGVFTVGLPDMMPEEAVRELRDAGYDGVEWRVTRVPEEARPRLAPLEDGVVDFGLVFEALEYVGYDGWLVMEDFSGVRPSREALRYNLEFIRSFV
jgi:sugar phosphate isomerase/epimerase